MSEYGWYIVQAHSGYEKKVAKAIADEADRKGVSDYFEEIFVPTEEVVEVRKGKKVSAEKKFFPGYVIVKMQMHDAAWQLVRSIPKVSGFLGSKGTPQRVSDKTVDDIYKQMQEGLEKPKHLVSFEIGESVRVIDGPFDSFVGVVEDVDEEKGKLKVSVSIFGRSTPVELEFAQVEKV